MHSEIRIYASDEVKFKIVEEVKKELSQKYPVIDVDGLRVTFPKGWSLIRASSREPVLTLSFQGETEGDLEAIKSEIKEAVEKVIKKLGKA